MANGVLNGERIKRRRILMTAFLYFAHRAFRAFSLHSAMHGACQSLLGEQEKRFG